MDDTGTPDTEATPGGRQATPDKRTPPAPHDPDWVENAAYAAMLRRMLRAYARRIGEHGPEDLTEMLAILAEFEALVGDGVRRLRAEGYSWERIGQAASMARQSAWERWGQEP